MPKAKFIKVDYSRSRRLSERYYSYNDGAIMKFFLLTSCYVFLAYLFLTCRRDEVEPDPFSDGTPRLKSISFSGIPEENISIDQKSKVILVKMPSVLLDKIAIKLDLTENAEWTESGVYYVSPNSFGCESCLQFRIKDKKGIYDETIYTVKTSTDAPLQVALLTQPVPYTIRETQEGIDIQMINLYGNILPKEARLTYENSTEQLIIKRSPFYNSTGVQFSANANKLSIYLYDQKLLPGRYAIALVMDDGTILNVPQPMIVSKGISTFDYEAQTFFGYRAPAGTLFTVSGYNLFEGDVGFEIVDKLDRVQAVTGLTFERYGRQIQVPVASSLLPGQYVLRVFLKGIKQNYCFRLSVLKDDQPRPLLGTLVTGTDPLPCSLRDPVVAQRGMALFFTSNQTKEALDKQTQQVNLKLVPLDTGATIYTATVKPYDSATVGGIPGSFIISDTVPAGLYIAILQILDAQNNVVNESEPYGRILKVQ